MSAKSKEPYPFTKVGDTAIVRDTRDGKVMNAGKVVEVKPGRVTFEGLTNDKREPRRLGRWSYRRKGVEWIELKADRLRLESPT